MNASIPPGTGLPPVLGTPQEEAPANRLRWGIHLGLISSYLLIAALLGWKRSAVYGPALSHTASGLLRVCGWQLALFAVVIGLAWLASRASKDDLLCRWRGGVWVIPLAVGYSIGLRLLVAVAAMMAIAFILLTHMMSLDQVQHLAIANRPNVEALVDPTAMRQDRLYYWLTVTLVSFVVAGLREELWRSAFLAALRKLWPRCFGSTAGQIAAVTIGAIVFGFGHLAQGVVAVGAATILGLGLGVIMVLHRSIWPAVLAHGMFDATSFALLPHILEHLRSLKGSVL